ncbi:hypothetical protein PIB30_008814 [Stylosanthes scabra]|uniref:MENTAL domain-containing protein n=1 Tax=Stylosanthes scabra TaxID=79078 RepID=A0ABU6X2C7_9FABA|nr:hypothetical protein [Stylosanthes scabra]
MGFSKEEKSKRVLKTLFFLISMVLSLLLISAPTILVIADALLPSALLSVFSSSSPPSLSSSSLSLRTTLLSHFRSYDFRYSLVDIPLLSIARSLVIFCVYSLCDGPRLSNGPYLGVTTVCSVFSLMFVSLKAVYIFGNGTTTSTIDHDYVRSFEIALFVCSYVFAVGHVVVAYRTSCRERRKLLVYKIDIESISACKNGYSRFPKKILEEERVK